MIKQLSIVFLVLFAAFSGNAQNDAAWLSDSIVKLKKISSFTQYNVSGGNKSLMMKWTYNTQGQLETVFANGVFQDSSFYSYNKKGQLKQLDYYEMGSFSDRTVFKYDKKGRRKSETVYEKKDGRMIKVSIDQYQYDEQGHVTLQEHKAKGDNWKITYTNKYHEGRLAATKCNYSNKDKVVLTNYSYTDSSRTEREVETQKGEVKSKETRTYDLNNNLIYKKAQYQFDEKAKTYITTMRYRNNQIQFAEKITYQKGIIDTKLKYNVVDGLITSSPRKGWILENQYTYRNDK